MDEKLITESTRISIENNERSVVIEWIGRTPWVLNKIYRPIMTETTVGFTIHNVTNEDAGHRHTVIFSRDGDTLLQDDNAVIAIEKSPSDPIISVKPTGDLHEGQYVTLTCDATVRTLPASEARELVYIWKQINSEGNEEDTVTEDDQFIHRDELILTRISSTRTKFKCTVMENGSTLSIGIVKLLRILPADPPESVSIPTFTRTTTTAVAITTTTTISENYSSVQDSSTQVTDNDTQSSPYSRLDDKDSTLIIGLKYGLVPLVVVISVVLGLVCWRARLRKRHTIDDRPSFLLPQDTETTVNNLQLKNHIDKEDNLTNHVNHYNVPICDEVDEEYSEIDDMLLSPQSHPPPPPLPRDTRANHRSLLPQHDNDQYEEPTIQNVTVEVPHIPVLNVVSNVGDEPVVRIENNYCPNSNEAADDNELQLDLYGNKTISDIKLSTLMANVAMREGSRDRLPS